MGLKNKVLDAIVGHNFVMGELHRGTGTDQ